MISCKKMFVSALMLSCTGIAARAQIREGRVVYERKVDMHRHLEDPSMKNMVPEFSISKAELLFSGDECLFRNIKEDEDIRDQAGKDEGPHINIKMGGSDDQYYKNYAISRGAEQRELGPKKYIIADSLPDLRWHPQTDTLTILGYLCHKAIGKDTHGNPVVAWYAENILSPAGPETFGGLPGLILLLNDHDGDFTLTATAIDAGTIDKTAVRAPTGGKQITRAGFKKMMEEQFGPDAGNGKTHIRIIRQ